MWLLGRVPVRRKYQILGLCLLSVALFVALALFTRDARDTTADLLSTGAVRNQGGVVGAFVASQGSGGTLTGVGRFLREQDARVRLYAVEPEECALLARREWGPHGIEGIGDGFIPENLDVAILSGVITTTTDESLVMARRLAAEEGIFCGISTGCNVAAALKLARHRPDLPSIVTMANDTGQRYFTTALCGEDKKVEVPEREHPMDPRTRRELDQYQPTWEILA